MADIVPRFRWVALQLAALDKCLSAYEITQQLANLPAGLDDFYKWILKEIDKEYRADTRTFLQWLAFSKRLMTIAEIAATIIVDFASEDGPVFILEKQYHDPRDMLVRCSSLVSELAGTVTLILHFSIHWQGRQVLLSSLISPSKSIFSLITLRNIFASTKKPLIQRSWKSQSPIFYSSIHFCTWQTLCLTPHHLHGMQLSIGSTMQKLGGWAPLSWSWSCNFSYWILLPWQIGFEYGILMPQLGVARTSQWTRPEFIPLFIMPRELEWNKCRIACWRRGRR